MKVNPRTPSLPATDPLDNPNWRSKEIPPPSFILTKEDWAPRSKHLEKACRLDFLRQKPTPFELSVIASNIAGDTAKEKVSSALDVWNESLQALAPKEPPRASLPDFLQAVWPKKTRAERMEWLREFLFSEIQSEKENNPHQLKRANSPKALQASTHEVERRIESFSQDGVEYPLELAERAAEWGKAESERRISEGRAKGGKAKHQKNANPAPLDKKTGKAKKVLGGTKSPASKELPPASSAPSPASKKWVSRKQRPPMR